jgi:ABC-type nickel/cobalt efflux system permease component RcnA
MPTQPVAAHPLGNFSVNQYSRLEVGTERITLTYVLDLAELPTVADASLLDSDANGTVDVAERERYLETKLAEIRPELHLAAGGAALALEPGARSLTFVPGQAGLETTRIDAEFIAALPAGSAADRVTYRNDYAAERLGWREIVVTHGPDIRLDEAETLAVDRSHALQTYPDDLLSSPLDERAAEIAFQIAPGTAASERATASTEAGPAAIGERLAAIVNGGDLTTTGMLLALLAAAAWGALHALSPGHGKTVVGAYLVGSRGTPRHALFLGLTVTITHTAGVLALGLVILFASRTIMAEQLYPWLSLVSGLLVAVLGLTILRQRLLGLPAFGHHHHHQHDHDHEHSHDHDHDHSHFHSHNHDHAHDHDHTHAEGIVHSHGGHTHRHLPPGAEGERVTWRNLLALGISGGLLPCPSALLALLGAVAVGRAGFGLMVVIAFSLGLAATLTGVGLLFLYAGRFLERRAVAGPWSGLLRFAPAAAALAVTASGVMIVARALLEIQRI